MFERGAKTVPVDRWLRCSFCGKAQNEVGMLIAGPNIFICDECVGLCQEIIKETQTPTE